MWSVVGFEKQKTQFEKAIKEGSLSHAYLFSGPEMVGKKSFAHDIHAILNNCPVGEQLDSDFKVIAPRTDKDETKIYIEDIRDLKSFMAVKPILGSRKFVVIDEADRLTEEASNALLKILEEPPEHAVIILISSKPGTLLNTIRSRCREVRFMTHSDSVVEKYLADQEITRSDVSLITLLAGGRLGWAVKIVNDKEVTDLRREIDEFQDVLKKPIAERMQYARSLYESDKYLQTVDIWIRWVRAHGKNPDKTLVVLRDLLNLSRLLSQPQYNHRLALENFLINV